MKTRINRLHFVSVLSTVIACLPVGCASTKEAESEHEEAVQLAHMSAPARETALHETAGGSIQSILREIEKGRWVYDVEATVGDKHVEYTIAESDGAVLGRETQMAFLELPEPVRAAAGAFFDTTSGLLVMDCREYGEVSYEIEGKRKGRTVEAMFDPRGKRIE